MLRPIIESIYDYRMVYTPEPLATRSTFKHNYQQSCAFIASEQALKQMNHSQSPLEQTIDHWNSKARQAQKERWDGKNADYKNKLDEIFRGADKSYYKGREYERTSRERSIDSYDRSKDTHFKDRYGERYQDKESRHQYYSRAHRHSFDPNYKHRTDRH